MEEFGFAQDALLRPVQPRAARQGVEQDFEDMQIRQEEGEALEVAGDTRSALAPNDPGQLVMQDLPSDLSPGRDDGVELMRAADDAALELDEAETALTEGFEHADGGDGQALPELHVPVRDLEFGFGQEMWRCP